MRTYNLKRLSLAVAFTVSIVSNAFAFQGLDPALAREVLSHMGPGSSIETNEMRSQGMVTYTMQIRQCLQSGGSCTTKVYRTTRSEVSIESQHIMVETVDMRGPWSKSSAHPKAGQKEPDYDRINFKVAPIPSGTAADAANFPPRQVLSYDVDPRNSAYQELMAVAPAVASGVYSGFQDMQASARIASQLQRGYERTLDGFRHAGDPLVENATAQSVASDEASAYLHVLAAAAMVPVADSVNHSPDFQDYQRAAADPFSFREFELTSVAREKFLQDIRTGVRDRKISEVVDLGSTLLHEKDPSLRAKAANELRDLFRDGVLRTQAFGVKSASVLDLAKFNTLSHTAGGEIVRKIANKAQATWLRHDGLRLLSNGDVAAYGSALVALRAADESFVRGQGAEGLYLSEVADSMLNFVGGFAQGGFAELSEVAHAIPQLAHAVNSFAQLLATNPGAAADKFGDVIASVPRMVEAMAVRYKGLARDITKGTAAERGAATGRLASEVLMVMITDGAASAVKGGTVAATAALRGSRLGQMAGALAKSSLAPAVELAGSMSPSVSESVAVLANVKPGLAADVLNTSERLAVINPALQGEYMDFVVKQAGSVGEKLQSTVAMTNAAQKGAIQTAEQFSTAKSLMDVIDQASHQIDLRQVGTNGKMAIIGRGMDRNVRPVAELFEKNGLKVEMFKLSEAAEDQWKNWAVKYNGDIPVALQRESLGYMENKKWIQKVIDEGYTVIDANNPLKLEKSIYYDELERGSF